MKVSQKLKLLTHLNSSYKVGSILEALGGLNSTSTRKIEQIKA